MTGPMAVKRLPGKTRSYFETSQEAGLLSPTRSQSNRQGFRNLRL